MAGVLLALWLVMPLVPLAIWSFAHGWRFPALLPQDWSLKAWSTALDPSSGVLESLMLTTGIAIACTPLGGSWPATGSHQPSTGRTGAGGGAGGP